MKKIFLGAFIFLDLILIGGSGFFMYTYVSRKWPAQSMGFLSSSTKSSTPPGAASPAPTNAAKPAEGGLLTPPAPSNSATRKILFTYRSPRSKQVSIRADFTGWKAEPMKKEASGIWKYEAILTAGQEYAYCYTADDKTFKDPNNKRTKQIGRTVVSAIVVQALPPKTTK